MIVFVWEGGGHFSAHYTYKNMKQVSKFRNFVLGVEFLWEHNPRWPACLCQLYLDMITQILSCQEL